MVKQNEKKPPTSMPNDDNEFIWVCSASVWQNEDISPTSQDLYLEQVIFS